MSIFRYLPIIVGVSIVASLSPFIVCVILFLFYMTKQSISDRNMIAIIVCSSILIGAVNAVKVLDNDLLQSIELFHLAKEMPLSRYIWVGSSAGGMESTKEPLYPVIVWLMNKLCLDNEVLFKFFFSVISYCLLNVSVLIVGRKNNLNSRYILFGILMMTFIPYIFTLSMQLLRQFLASSIFMVIISLASFTSIKKLKLVVMSVCMFLIHSSSLFFIPFIFIQAFERKWKDAKIWYIGAALFFFFIQFVSGLLLKIVGDNNSLGYALDRASRDTVFESEKLGIAAIGLLLVIIYVSFKFVFLVNFKEDKGIRRFFNVPFFLSIFVLFNLNQRELALRMLFYTYPFVPFIVMFYAYRMKFRLASVLLISLLSIISFLLYIQFGVWTYKIPFSIFFTPLAFYLV